MKHEIEDKNLDRNWFKKHAETITLMATIFGGFIWMDGKIDKVNDRLSIVEKDVAIIKIVLSMKGFDCFDLANKEDQEKK